MGLYKRGNTWWLNFFHNGERIATSTKQTDRTLAERWAASYRAAVQENRFLPRAKDATLGDVLERYLEIHLRAKNPKNYVDSKYKVRFLLSKMSANTPVSRLRSLADDYRAWRMQSKVRSNGDKTVAPATVNRELSILKSATRKALEWGMISDDPLAGFKLARVSNARVRYLEDDEFDRLMNVAHPELAPIILMARHTGMRQGEILNLEWSDVDLRRGWIRIRHSKNGEGRFVPLSARSTAMLSNTPHSNRVGLLFERHGVRMDRNGWLRDQFAKAVRQAGLIDFHFHDLRHCWASHAAMRGADIQTIAAILGHKTLRMTQRYSHLSAAHLKASIELAAPRKSQETATKTLQSDPPQAASFEEPETSETRTPPFLAANWIAQNQLGMGIEPTTSSLPTSTPSAPNSGENSTSRRQYDLNAN